MPSTTDPLIFDGHNDTLLDLCLPGRGNQRSFLNKAHMVTLIYRVRRPAALAVAFLPFLCHRRAKPKTVSAPALVRAKTPPATKRPCPRRWNRPMRLILR